MEIKHGRRDRTDMGTSQRLEARVRSNVYCDSIHEERPDHECR